MIVTRTRLFALIDTGESHSRTTGRREDERINLDRQED